ncbi:unnamed protein product [Protopolystoma xenopodis]|uniref:UBR-type domain-containing protein n=1 Tax=Protopolystoma xenopodis TaxID=117903 RepID=A0A3S5AKM8_9PLAT|nr:unnamed protein product [Protopolystoma xenopodis]
MGFFFCVTFFLTYSCCIILAAYLQSIDGLPQSPCSPSLLPSQETLTSHGKTESNEISGNDGLTPQGGARHTVRFLRTPQSYSGLSFSSASASNSVTNSGTSSETETSSRNIYQNSHATSCLCTCTNDMYSGKCSISSSNNSVNGDLGSDRSNNVILAGSDGSAAAPKLDDMVCTFGAARRVFVEQHWYYCYTCRMLDSQGVCSTCARVCHAGHDIVYAKSGNFFCDCANGFVPSTTSLTTFGQASIGLPTDRITVPPNCQALHRRVLATTSTKKRLPFARSTHSSVGFRNYRRQFQLDSAIYTPWHSCKL